MDEADIKAIADGRQPKPWSYTTEHPVYGPLTFRAELPRTTQLLAHSRMRDQLIGDDEEPSMNTQILASAMAALRTLIEVPVLRETREEDPDDPNHVKITKVFYDADAEFNENFLADVWINYANWRATFFDREGLDALGEGSGETAGADSGASSNGSSDSPSTIPDSTPGLTPTTSAS